MNRLDYASLEASKRLAEAGIVLETEAAWCEYNPNDWSIGYKKLIIDNPKKRFFIPAPSMAEVWKELPEEIYHVRPCALMVWKFHNLTEAGYWQRKEIIKSSLNANPTDALIDLLIRVRKGKGEMK
jgi:hypothetical protein